MVRAGRGPSRRPVAKRQSTSGTSRSVPLQLAPDRAFVLHLDVHACLPRRLFGRVEHIASGRVTHITSVRGLLNFLIDVLRDEARRTETSGSSETVGRRDER